MRVATFALPSLLLGLLLGLSACGGEKKESREEAASARPSTADATATDEPAAKPAPAKPAGRLPESCPEKTALSSLRYQPPNAPPFELDPEAFTVAKARRLDAKEGEKLQIFIATDDFPVEKMGLGSGVIANDGQAFLILTIRSERLAAGRYEETGDLASKVSGTLVTKGLASAMVLAKGSTIELAHVDGRTVCGTVDAQGIFDGKKTRIEGRFVAPMADRPLTK